MSADRIPSKVVRSDRSGLYVATVFGPAPWGGSSSLAFEAEADAWAWVSEQEEGWR